MTAKEDKKTPARVGRVPGLILAQRWGRPSLAGGVLCFWDKLICSAIPESIGTDYQHQKCSALAENPA